MVNVELPATEPTVAVIVLVPGLIPVALPPSLMPATLMFEDDHATELVMSAVLPFV
jgi:hypothetical protein